MFRGGVITGGAPFTKDVVYLFGLLQVSFAIRGAFAAGRSDVLRMFFCGKLDALDIPALCEQYAMGLVRAPLYLPPWISDPRYFFALFTYSTFMNQVDIGPMVEVVQQLLAHAPVVKLQAGANRKPAKAAFPSQPPTEPGANKLRRVKSYFWSSVGHG